jgi:hypothetical protein
MNQRRTTKRLVKVLVRIARSGAASSTDEREVARLVGSLVDLALADALGRLAPLATQLRRCARSLEPFGEVGAEPAAACSALADAIESARRMSEETWPQVEALAGVGDDDSTVGNVAAGGDRP